MIRIFSIQAACRLIRQDNFTFVEYQAGNSNALLFSARKLIDCLIQNIAKPHIRQYIQTELIPPSL